MTPDETRYRIMRLLEADPSLSQRRIARELGISLGKVNYCLHALIDRGWVKATNFARSEHKGAYAYLLTPRGMRAKAAVAAGFLRQRLAEQQALEQEIEALRAEVLAGPAVRPPTAPAE